MRKCLKFIRTTKSIYLILTLVSGMALCGNATSACQNPELIEVTITNNTGWATELYGTKEAGTLGSNERWGFSQFGDRTICVGKESTVGFVIHHNWAQRSHWDCKSVKNNDKIEINALRSVRENMNYEPVVKNGGSRCTEQ